MTFLAVIAKRFGDTGLMPLMIESGTLSSCSAHAVLNRKHYNRAIRLNKLIMEALQKLRCQEFENLPNLLDTFIQAVQSV